MSEIIMKKCTGTCGEVKEVNNDNFYKDKSGKYGFRAECINCFGKKKPTHIIEENNIKYQICTGECQLKKELIIENFELRSDTNKFRRKCKICCAKYIANYNDENKEKISVRRKAKYNENKDEILKKAKEYSSRPKVRERRREKDKQNRKNNVKTPKNRIRDNIRCNIRHCFKRRNTTKSRSINKSLPYTIDDLIAHLELYFNLPENNWMTLNNQGVYNPATWDDNDTSTWKWQLDHIIPESTFNYISEDDEEFKICWYLFNLRPYPAKQNIIDGLTKIRH